jgi:secreted PhoX family phosphatase
MYAAEGLNIIPVVGKNPYDKAGFGGTTSIIVDADRNEVKSFVSSSGTFENCAGGATPWGTWLTCEETTPEGYEEDGYSSDLVHGYVYEVDPMDPENELSRTPIKEMGLFEHEAMGYDTDTGYVYLTQDGHTEADPADPSKDTGGSFLYRFIPNDLSRKPGALQKGGTLQALKAVELPTANDADLYTQGQSFGVTWVDVVPEDATNDAHAKDCLHFNRLEGARFDGGALWFCDTNGGEQRLGQIFRYIPSTNTLELFYEGDDRGGPVEDNDNGVDWAKLESPDNITVAPWGDVIVAEDGGGINRLIGFTPEGDVYVLAEHNVPYPYLEAEGLPANFRSEVTGPTFSPDGQTLFFNCQTPGVTFAVWGPFKRASEARKRQMSVSAPPAALAPFISGELAEAADRHGLSILEAAAFHRPRVPIL